MAITTLLGIGWANAQVNGYTFSQATTGFSEISGGTILATATANSIGAPILNSGSFPITLPFTFKFNNVDYTSIYASVNGFITFGTTEPTTTTIPISGTGTYGGAVAPFGGDLNSVFNISGKTGDLSWIVSGTAPNRELTVQWRNFRPSYSTCTTSAYAFHFQVKLFETTNVISTSYTAGNFLIGSTASSGTRQIGLRGATNNDFFVRTNSATELFGNSSSGSLNTSAQTFNDTTSPPGMPADGLTYTWTPPNCWGPLSATTANATTTTVDLSWTAPNPAPANGYEIYYTTAPGNPPANATPQFTTNLTHFTLNGLTPGTTYYIWIRSSCSPSLSGWTYVAPITTVCAPVTYKFENFEAYATGNIVPNCWIRLAAATTPGSQTITTTTPYSGVRNMYMYATSTQTPVTVVLPEFSNVSAGTHWLRLRARTSSATGALKIGYVTNPNDATTFVVLQTLNLANITYDLTSEYTVIVPTSVPATARLAIQNTADAKSYYFDDVYWEPVPTCFPPTALTVTGQTSTTGSLSWTAPTTPPTNGYTVYYSTSNTSPTSSTVLNSSNSITATGTTATINGLSPATGYYVWVRSNCSATDVSTWSQIGVSFATLCQPPALTSTTGQIVCPNAAATLNATADTGITITWYDAATGENQLATGGTFTTPPLAATTNYYVTASNGSTGMVGKDVPVSTTGNSGFSDVGLQFDASTSFTLVSVDVYPMHATNTTGTLTIALKNSAGTVLQTTTANVNVSPGGVLNTVPLNFNVPAGTGHRLVMTAATNITNVIREITTGFTYPYVLPGVASITSAYTGGVSTTYYYYFYKWMVSTKCESARTQVTATVDSACMGTSEVDNEKVIKIYPNPFTDFITISEAREMSKVTVNDLSGRLIKTIIKPASKIDLHDLKSGLYLLKFEFKDGTVKTAKVIKN